MAAKNQKPVGQGRGMVGGVYRSGQYKGKTTGLTKKQVSAGKRVGSAGKPSVGKKEATRAMKPVKIENTTWRTAAERTGPRAKGGILVGNDGKPVTGTVTLASGKTATYVRGKRVAAATAKPKPASTGRSAGGGSNTGAKPGKPRSVSDFSGSSSSSGRSATPSSDNLRTMGRARSIARRTGSAQAGRQASTIKAVGKPMSTPRYQTGAPQKKVGRQVGQVRSIGNNKFEKWNGSAWVPTRRVNGRWT